MGGIKADARMETELPGLLAAGEAVGGANGANRLSGNAITEALVFGRQAGRSAAARAKRLTAQPFDRAAARAALDLIRAERPVRTGRNTAEMVGELQAVMARGVGPFRTAEKLQRAVAELGDLTRDLGERPAGGGAPFDLERLDWFDLRNMLLVAHTVAEAAAARTESRGAHQREDFPAMQPDWRVNQEVRLSGGRLQFTRVPAGVKVAA
jgi:succinate dehydrogenase/fumarate reductase flavoprotein subunit